MRTTICCLLAAALMPHSSGYSQGRGARATESHKYRVIGTVAGAGGGYALGVIAGLAVFDDAINSTRKVWTTALLGAAGGAVGGYFLGRVLDKKSAKSAPAPVLTPWMPDRLDRSVAQAILRLGREEQREPEVPAAGTSGNRDFRLPPPDFNRLPRHSTDVRLTWSH